MPPFSLCVGFSSGRGDRESLCFARWGRLCADEVSPPSLIHSGGSLLVEEQAATPAPPWRSSSLVASRVLCHVAQREVILRSYAMVDGE
jgi:hypothetical protein